jgi:hypothetical protein
MTDARSILARWPLSILFLVFLLLPSCTSQPHSINLYNGHDLSNWTRRGGEASYTAQGDCIVGETRPNQANSFLCTNATYRNFILELDFIDDPNLNSGIQIRSESKPDYKNGVVHGYQVEIDPSPRAWTAGIYDESRRGWLVPLDKNPAAQKAFRQNDWNHLKIIAQGDHIQTWLNGVPAADLRDSMTSEGFIGLQVHGVGNREGPLQIRWKNLILTPLP